MGSVKAQERLRELGAMPRGKHPGRTHYAPGGPVERFVGRYGTGQVLKAASALGGTPFFAYEAGKAIGQDVGSTIHGKPTVKHSGRLGKELVSGSAYALTHPWEDLPMTALTALGVGSIGAQAGARGMAAAHFAKEGPVAAVKAAVRRPPPGARPGRPHGDTRTLRFGKFETQGYYSRSPLFEAAQRLHDKAVHKTIESEKTGFARERVRSHQARRVSAEERGNRLIRGRTEQYPAMLLSRHHLTTPQQGVL